MKVKDNAVRPPSAYPEEPSILAYLFHQHREVILLCPRFVYVARRPQTKLELPHIDGPGDESECVVSENAPPAFVGSGRGKLDYEQPPCKEKCCRYTVRFVSQVCHIDVGGAGTDAVETVPPGSTPSQSRKSFHMAFWWGPCLVAW